METLTQEIKDILKAKLGDKFVYNVSKQTNFFGGDYIQIWMACSMIDINEVRGQKPQVVSLSLDIETLELAPQVFAGNGGQRIYRKPNLEDPSEKYLAMKGVKVPFRKPQPTKEKVKESIAKFADNYIKTLRENKATLKYQDIVDYDSILK